MKMKKMISRYGELWDKINFSNLVEKDNPYSRLETIIEYTSTNKEIFEINNLTQSYKKFKNVKTIYEDINLKFYAGENVAILGPNGAGKTTLVETICGTKKPTSGTIDFKFNYVNNPHERMGMQFQDLKFPSSLTVKDIIEFILDLSDLSDIEPNELNNLLNIFSLRGLLKMKASKLSGGQQQRLNVFLSIIHKPQILVLDEFTTGLDIAIKNSMQYFIKNYVKENKISLILISHDIDAIDYLYDRVIILADRHIKIDMSRKQVDKRFGTIKELLKQYIAY
ncbi:MAG: ABC transporter ATP-binding protein [Malacoplasma sp.]